MPISAPISHDSVESVNVFHRKKPCSKAGRYPGVRPQSPDPDSGEKNFRNFSGTPSQSLASGGASFLTVIFAQVLAYWALSSSHFSRPGSVSGLIASAGHSGSHTPQSMHSSG